jgi:hypothetical protein
MYGLWNLIVNFWTKGPKYSVKSSPGTGTDNVKKQKDKNRPQIFDKSQNRTPGNNSQTDIK